MTRRSEDRADDAVIGNHRLGVAAAIGFGLTLVVLLLGGVLGCVNALRLADHGRIVAHTYEVIGSLETLLSTLKDAETGQRGYLLAEDEKYLEPYEHALKRVGAELAHLTQLTSDNQVQQTRLGALDKKIIARLDELKNTVGLMKAGDRASALKLVRGDTGKNMMDGLRQDVAAIRQLEFDLLTQRISRMAAIQRATIVSILLPAFIGVVLVGVAFYVSQRSVRQRQRAAYVLAEQKERLRTTLASIGDAVISTDAAGNVTYLNAVAESLTGWTNDNAAGLPLTQVFHIVNEFTRQPVGNPALRALSEGVVVGLANHTVLIAKDGTERSIDDSAAPIRCSAGKVVGCVLVFRDISELKRLETVQRNAEAQVRESEERFRTLADNIPQLAWIADAGTDGQVHWFNKNWFDYTGTTLEQMRGSGWHAVHHPDHADRVIKKFAHHVQEGLDWEDTFPLRRKDGQFRWFLSRMKVIRDESGIALRIFGTNTDITESMQMAEDLRKLTAELSKAGRRKDEFLATLAHELRNPLAPVRNAVQILHLKGPDTPELQWARDVIDRQVQQMSRLIEDLMDLSRINQGKIELKRERVELAKIVQGAVESSRPLIEENGHKLTVTLPPGPLVIDADLTRLAQVFLNLLNNAAKYTQQGGRIDLTAEKQGSDVTISVRDSGIGIPADNLSSIFEMFSQVESALSRSQGGLGIGLCLVQRLVEMHGGSIEARSEGIGKGSEFVVRLPLVVEPTYHRQSNEESDEAMPTSSLRILVVDDNRDAASSLAMLLKMMGNHVRSAHDGEEAVTAAFEFTADIVLLDIGLPKLNGYEACRRIRAQPWGEKMILIAVTGWGQDEDERKSDEAGFDRHMVKPVDPKSLMKLLAELSDSHRKNRL